MSDEVSSAGAEHLVGKSAASVSPQRVIGPVDVGPIAHGGHCIARHEGRVIFVRHSLPGEQVMVRLTDTSHGRYWRGDAVEILEAAPGRITPPCAIAGSCGGCDFQHVELGVQRELKTAVVRELMHHFAHLDTDVEVQPAPDERDGQSWRTRMRYGVVDGHAALHKHRSSELVPLAPAGCLIAEDAGRSPAMLDELAGRLQPESGRRDAGGARSDELVVATSMPQDTSTQQVNVMAGHQVLVGSAQVSEQVAGNSFQVRADGFWQPHRKAPQILTSEVLEVLRPVHGDRALDLYCGVGVFAAALADTGARVTGIELDGPAIRLARGNVPQARFIAGRVDRVLAKNNGDIDLVVLDPPRVGAGKQAVARIARLAPRSIAYVACDPAALARDIAFFAKHDYRVTSLKAFDLFPMTHHVECVAGLERV